MKHYTWYRRNRPRVFPFAFALALVSGAGLAARSALAQELDAGSAVQARAAVQAARMAVQETGRAAQLWTPTDGLLKQAETALRNRQYPEARKQAELATAEAQLAYSQFFQGKARFIADRLERTQDLNAAQRARLKSVDALVRRHAGKPAYVQAAALERDVLRNHQMYRVRPGDTLAIIAARFYGAPDYWRAVYDANKSRIADPNHLVVGQELVIGARLGD
ncbi:MAG: LysM peptidoglycan-binding domain-containing protein [Gammaproteobacteria bacterium]|nr:LysM peptidoglycan-binding domain-containing protein [Gammaproteobacteria bacterium]